MAENNKKTKNIIFIVIQAVIIAICLFGAIFIMVQNKATTSNIEKFNTKMMVVETDSMEPTIKTKSMIFSNRFDEEKILDIGTVVTYYVKNGKSTNGKDKFFTITHRIVGYYYYDSKIDRNSKIYGNVRIKTFTDLANSKIDEIKFIGYITRGDKYTFENGATLDDYNIYNNDGSINYNLDDVYYSYLTNDLILSVWSGTQSYFLGSLVVFLQQPNNLMLCIVLPIILLIVYNMFLVIREIINDKKNKAKEEAINSLSIDEEEIKRKAIEEYLANQKEEK